MKKLLWNAAEIRAELYALWNDAREAKTYHLHCFATDPDPRGVHPEPCRLCEREDGSLHGINRAIRRFGGRINRGRLP